ncbi:MAG TPA: MFS transporter [Solirubrobacteraceae bacterium]|nr:MFS transporter [Solirubrobacteraceae bacterium]
MLDPAKVGPLANSNFRRFYAGYATSLLGTGLSNVAVAFAVLDSGHDSSALGLVLTASVGMTIAFLLVGGVIGDRFSRRAVMLGSDVLRFAAQGAFAGLVLAGHPSTWSLALCAALVGAGTGLFSPTLTALTTEIIDAERLHDANVLIGLAKSAGVIAGPALAGALVVLTSAGVVVAIDAATYAVSVISLALLELPPVVNVKPQSLLAGLADGWGAWSSRSWIWITDIKFAFSNAIVLAPLLVLGPTIAKHHLGGAAAWGTILTAQGAGAVAAGLLLAGRRPRRPLVVITVAQAGWSLPVLALALLLPVPVIAAGGFLAGVGSATFLAIWTTTLQRNVPGPLLARVSSYDDLASFALGPIGLAFAGPVAASIGTTTLLAIGGGWQLLSTVLVLALPQTRTFGESSTERLVHSGAA